MASRARLPMTGGAPVVVVGGGLSGLAAAVHLARSDIPAVLIDDGCELGGRARTHCRDGFHLNYGPHRLYERGAAVRLLRELGIPIDVAPRGPNGGFAVWRRQKFTLPVGLCSLLTTGLLSLHAKREAARLLRSIPAIDIEALDRVPFGEWLRIRVGDPDVLSLVLAFVRYSTYSAEPDRLSASAAIDQLRLSLTGGVMLVHRGWGALVAALHDAAESMRVDVVHGRVTAVNTERAQATGVMLDDGSCMRADAVIIATGPATARRLLSGPPLDVPPPIRVAALDVALKRLPHERTIFAVGIDEPWSFSADSAMARVAPRDGAVVHLAKYLPTGTQGTCIDEHELEQSLDLLQPGWRELIVYRRFLPTIVVSHMLVAAEAGGFAGRPDGRAPGLRNVFLAGDWIGPTGQLADASLASGIAAARAVVRLTS